MRHVVDCGGLYSFISSHAANSFAVAFFTSMILKIRFFLYQSQAGQYLYHSLEYISVFIFHLMLFLGCCGDLWPH